MRDHATHTVGEVSPVADTARTAVLPAAGAPSANPAHLARLDDVTRFELSTLPAGRPAGRGCSPGG
ncbi:hypothetical protein BKE56_028125 [Rhodococcus sp. M8]|nr:hypothetical protein BKE56_028125 [Rhodococcus sp. M8]